MTKRNENDIAIDGLICFLLGAVTVAIVGKPLAGTGAALWWWGFFMLCNFAYLAYGIKKGWAKADPANGLLIATGPIAFYSWTYMLAWRKYGRKTNGHKKDQT